MNEVAVQLHIRPGCEDLGIPAYHSDLAAGCDLRAALEGELTLVAGGIAGIPTGLSLAIPEGFEGQVRPRSGLAARHGVTVVNAPGTIDADYRGEITVVLVNLGAAPLTLRRGDRIAQLVIAPVVRARFESVATLPETARGAGGFGSTGA